MKTKKKSGFEALEITEIARKAIGTALLHHKVIGNEIVFWKDGRIVHEKTKEYFHPVKPVKQYQNNEFG
ncbi:MAG: hypothetical protein U9R57_05250 [Thermodesulfobacteriota bacterium]|nr:hypothetical protein [Thermodesulfobacteriota bacterium]